MKYLLLPFSWLFGLITWLRNKAYDRGLLKVYHSGLKSIVIGNLQVGGAGKTPMTAWLYQHLSAQYNIAILSRGYGRKTKGLIKADEFSRPDDIGDEPYWYHENLKVAQVIVSEDRSKGMRFLESTPAELVLLDDAYQHRAFGADVYLLLSDFNKPYFKDYPMPLGRMREYRTGDKRADFIVFTKCHPELDLEEKIRYINACNPLDHQEVYFTCTRPGNPLPLKGGRGFADIAKQSVLAVSGLANADDFHRSLEELQLPIEKMEFGDHHHYTSRDIDQVLKSLKKGGVVICTEKDAVKLRQSELLQLIPENLFFVLPIETEFLFGESGKFLHSLKKRLSEKRK